MGGKILEFIKLTIYLLRFWTEDPFAKRRVQASVEAALRLRLSSPSNNNGRESFGNDEISQRLYP